MLQIYHSFPLGESKTRLLAVSREADPDEIVEFANDILTSAKTMLYLIETNIENDLPEKHSVALYGVQMMMEVSIGLIESLNVVFDEYPPPRPRASIITAG